MDVSATFPPDPQPPILVLPGQGALQPSTASDPAPSRAPRPPGDLEHGPRTMQGELMRKLSGEPR